MAKVPAKPVAKRQVNASVKVVAKPKPKRKATTKAVAKIAATAAKPKAEKTAPEAVLTISSKNYGAWALRGWLLTKFSGLDFVEKIVPPDDPDMKAGTRLDVG